MLSLLTLPYPKKIEFPLNKYPMKFLPTTNWFLYNHNSMILNE